MLFINSKLLDYHCEEKTRVNETICVIQNILNSTYTCDIHSYENVINWNILNFAYL